MALALTRMESNPVSRLTPFVTMRAIRGDGTLSNRIVPSLSADLDLRKRLILEVHEAALQSRHDCLRSIGDIQPHQDDADVAFNSRLGNA